MRDALAGEWLKLRSVSSTYWLAATAVLTTTLLGILVCALLGSDYRGLDAEQQEAFDPVGLSCTGVQFGQLAIVILAVRAAGSEFTTGLIRISLAAVPDRRTFLTAKLITLALVGLGCGLLSGMLSVALGTATLTHGSTLLLTPEGIRSCLGNAAYFALLAAFSAAVAIMVRRTLTALGILLPLFFVLSGTLGVSDRLRPYSRLLPDRAGLRLMQIHQESGDLPPMAGGLVMLLWTAAAIVLGWWSLRTKNV
ncbi:ABC transporter permease [Kitasatospora sp. NPDC089509]|uniref:ABC transporter permease n=1 Tax=Kitasatospora sp. NPDC089509 TaxID=3364079 RepID=UPI00381AABFE